MYPKQGTKEPGEGKSGCVKRDPQNTVRDHSGSVPVQLPECLHVNSSSLENKQQQQKLLDQNTKGKRNKARDPGEHRVGRQELTGGQLSILST